MSRTNNDKQRRTIAASERTSPVPCELANRLRLAKPLQRRTVQELQVHRSACEVLRDNEQRLLEMI